MSFPTHVGNTNISLNIKVVNLKKPSKFESIANV